MSSGKIAWEEVYRFLQVNIDLKIDNNRSKGLINNQEDINYAREEKKLQLRKEDLKTSQEWDKAMKALKFRPIGEQSVLQKKNGDLILNAGEEERAEVKELSKATGQSIKRFMPQGIKRTNSMTK